MLDPRAPSVAGGNSELIRVSQTSVVGHHLKQRTRSDTLHGVASSNCAAYAKFIKPLFGREHEFEAIPFPPVSIPLSAAKVHQVIVELLHAGVELLPPLIVLCRRSHITVEHYAIYYPQDATRYRKAVARQRKGPPIAPVALSRAFRIGLHLIEVGHVETDESSAEDRLKVLTGLAPAQCRVVLEACRLIAHVQ
jgi:hypothetical protein